MLETVIEDEYRAMRQDPCQAFRGRVSVAADTEPALRESIVKEAGLVADLLPGNGFVRFDDAEAPVLAPIAT